MPSPPLQGQRAGQLTPARKWIAGALQGVFVVGYPITVYVASTRLETRAMAFGLLAFYSLAIVLRFRGSASEIWAVVRAHIGLPILIGLAIATDNRTILLFLPVVVNLYMLWTFGSSLREGPPMAERFARIVEDDLPEFTLAYCRKLTIAWCVFFALNATSTGVLAVVAPVGWWALYTGFMSYGLIGLLFAGEFILRKVWFRNYTDGAVDRGFAALFPAERTENGRRSLAYVVARDEAATRAGK
jgi:uncharacterized membrane protein